jgi:multisubunit Na+/H+ antiporter MnhF subunit
MHPLMLAVATYWIAILLGIMLVYVFATKSTLSRILALDTLTLILIGFLALAAGNAGVSHGLDAALVLALLSFVGTVAAAHYYRRGRIF